MTDEGDLRGGDGHRTGGLCAALPSQESVFLQILLRDLIRPLGVLFEPGIEILTGGGHGAAQVDEIGGHVFFQQHAHFPAHGLLPLMGIAAHEEEKAGLGLAVHQAGGPTEAQHPRLVGAAGGGAAGDVDLGRAPPGMPARRTASTQAFSSPWESRIPTWQVAPPMQLTEVSNRVRAPSAVRARIFVASLPVRLMI